MAFSYDVSSKQQCSIYKLSGRFLEVDSDKSIVNNLMDELDVEPRDVIMDLEELDYINSMGIQLLIKVVRAVGEHDRKVVFVNTPPKVQELLEVIKLNSVLEIRPDISSGMKYLNNR